MSPEREQAAALRFALGAGFNLMLGVALVFTAILRETPMFWRNAGGFPVLLRDLVEWLFYPGLAVFSVCLLVTTAFAPRWPRKHLIGPL